MRHGFKLDIRQYINKHILSNNKFVLRANKQKYFNFLKEEAFTWRPTDCKHKSFFTKHKT